MDASYIIYTGIPTSIIPITPGQNLELILQNIDAAINAHNTAPDYSTYSLGCMRGSYTINTTQQFAEATAAMLCSGLISATTFIGTTYPADQAIITSAISALQIPGLTYSPLSITNTDPVNTIFTKIFTGWTANATALSNALYPTNTSWSYLSATPVTLAAAFTDIIYHQQSQDTAISARQLTIPTFDNTGNCLSGGATDSIYDTVSTVISYICSLPVYTSSDLSWSGCISQGGDLESDIQSILDYTTAIAPNIVIGAGTGLTHISLGACAGAHLAVDTTWSGLYKVMSRTSDTTPDYLYNKLQQGTGVVFSIVNPGANELVEVSVPAISNIGQVIVNSSDPAIGYIQDKIPSAVGDWGIAIQSYPSSDNTKLNLVPTIVDPAVFISNIMTYLSSDPNLLAQFCALQTQCAGCTCAAPTGLTVVLD